MTVVDAVIAVFVLAMAAIGYERGLIRSALPLLGFVAGVAIGARLGPALLNEGSESPYAPLITFACGLGLGALLALTLEGVGEAIRARVGLGNVGGRVDGAGGATLLALLALLLVWVVGAVALHTPGSEAQSLRQAIQRSAVLAALNDVLPPSGPLLNVLRRIDPTPSLEGPEANVPPPQGAIARDPEVVAAGDSVVKVLGTACGLGVEGSGWVAAPGLVVTNAHVVAGQDDTTVTPRAGEPELEAEAVYYEPRDDLAILSVEGLDANPLDLDREPRSGVSAAVLGYPENGPFQLTPARLGTTGTVASQDSYGRGPVRREMTSFRADVRGGNSGGPVVDGDGEVLTTVFAAEQDSGPPGGLGIPNDVVAAALDGGLGDDVGTGPCAA